MEWAIFNAMDTATLAFIAFALAAGGLVKGICGLGFPIVAMGLLTTTLPVPMALAIVCGPLVATNFWQAVANGVPMSALRRFWPVIVCLIGFTFVGARLVVDMDAQDLFLIVGVIVCVFCILNLWNANLTLPARWEPVAGLVAGSVAGMMAGISTIWGPPITMFFLSLRLPKDVFIQSVGLVWVWAALPVVIAYEWNGILNAETRPLALMAIPPALIALWIGERVRSKLPQEVFRKTLLILLLVIGANLIRRGLF